MIYKFLLVLGLLLMGLCGWWWTTRVSVPAPVTTTASLCTSGSPSRAFSNEFLATAEESCPNETGCCDRLLKKIDAQHTTEQKGMKECQKLVAPHYLPRHIHCYLKVPENCHLDQQPDGTWKASIEQAMIQCDCFTCLTP